ncbi:alpha/beta hydrolase family protein [Ceratobasidium sp. AG-Ba]|nr:alpha/beta hydrolase family protein [Ceratobasidium sp. AG-Ba]
MVLFPPFLREGAHRKKQEPNSTHHCAIFSHNSPSIVGDADIEWWPVDATQEQSEQSIPDFVFLFIPGNPGLVEFYTEFLDDIHRDISKTGKRLEIFVRGHIGQAPNLAPAKNALWSVGLEAQVMSVVELYDSIQDTYGPTVKVILGGHSVGAWIVTQVMHSRPNTAAAAFLLFPTVSNIASTPNGRKLSWLFHRPIPTVVSSFTRLLSLPPLSLATHSLPYLSKFHEYPSSQLEVIKSLITSPHVVYSALTMAHDEMNTIGSLGSAPSTVQATCERERHRTYACFAAKDEWVGDEIESVRKMLDEGKVVVRDDDVPHAFCIMPLSQKFA